MSTQTADKILLTVDEAAQALSVSRSTLLRINRQGKLGPRLVRIGSRKLVVARRELEEWAASGCVSRVEWIKRRKAASMVKAG